YVFGVIDFLIEKVVTFFETILITILDLLGKFLIELWKIVKTIPMAFFQLIVFISTRFMGFGGALSKFFPALDNNLKNAEITRKYGFHAREYLVVIFLLAVSIAIFSAILVSIPYTYLGRNIYQISILAGVVMGFVAFFYLLSYPKMIVARRISNINRNLLFAIQTMQVQIQGGLPVFNAMVMVADGEFGAISGEFKKVSEKVKSGESIIGCLEEMAQRNPSRYFSRVCWQISNSIKSGSSLAEDLGVVVDFLSAEQIIEIKKYGGQLNPLAMLYMMIAVIVPSLGVTVLIVISSLPLSDLQITETLFWILLFITLILQIVFMALIKSRRPDILGD
ncbi:MAG: type II secretion system F family protein, partial [Candidatus Altiarchaeota archaeon]